VILAKMTDGPPPPEAAEGDPGDRKRLSIHRRAISSDGAGTLAHTHCGNFVNEYSWPLFPTPASDSISGCILFRFVSSGPLRGAWAVKV
jgi:hypothetical protein